MQNASLRVKEYGSTPYAKIGVCFDCSTSPDFFKHVNVFSSKVLEKKYVSHIFSCSLPNQLSWQSSALVKRRSLVRVQHSALHVTFIYMHSLFFSFCTTNKYKNKIIILLYLYYYLYYYYLKCKPKCSTQIYTNLELWLSG